MLIDGVGELIFDYLIPQGVTVEAGYRVKVPIQHRRVLGTVIRISTDESSSHNLKPILEIISDEPLLTEKLLQLAEWLSAYYCAPLEHVIRTMLPASLRKERSFDKSQKVVELIKLPDEEELLKLEKRARRQHELLMTVSNSGGAVAQRLLGTGVSSPLKALVDKGYVRVADEVVKRDPDAGDSFLPSQALTLNEEQEVALKRILEAAQEQAKPFLLAGVTGSGKTEVYLQAADAVLRTGKTVIILVPEIALTPQTVRRFKSRFDQYNHPVAVLHSDLSAGERHDEWKRLRAGDAVVAIGARSAVFAPLENVGLIVVDEEHETSYKQESSPRYQARDLAVVRAHMEGCPIVLGSATPSLESWHNVQRGKYELIKIDKRADDQSMPRIRIIDMRTEARKAEVKPVIFSEKLREAIRMRLEIKEQTILFLNRRGFSRSALCPSCGHAVQCPHCSLSLTYHRKDDRMVCHLCQYMSIPPKKCPECHDPSILFAGYGTEKVQEITQKLFPKAKVARLDADITRRKGALKEALEDFRKHKTDILIGTQMIAKGLHFPTVTLVGVLNADLSLHTPDFRASERTFQLLTQVAGRSGRGPLEGEVIIQTFTPHAPSIQYARHHDYYGFAEQEMEFRKGFSYPPSYHMIVLLAASKNEKLAQLTLETIHTRLKEKLPDRERFPIILGEVLPAPLEKSHDEFRYQLLLRGANPRVTSQFIKSVLDRNPIPPEVRLTCDVDAYDMG